VKFFFLLFFFHEKKNIIWQQCSFTSFSPIFLSNGIASFFLTYIQVYKLVSFFYICCCFSEESVSFLCVNWWWYCWGSVLRIIMISVVRESLNVW
jgi:hypothetical protein